MSDCQVTHEDLLNMKNDIIAEVRKIVVEEHTSRDKAFKEINSLKFTIIENELSFVKKELSQEQLKNTGQHEQFYKAINNIDPRITASRESIMKELGNKSQFNITTLIAVVSFVGMIIIGLMTLL